VPELAFTDTTVRVMWFGQGRQRRGDGLERITSVKVGHSRAVTLRSLYVNGKTIQIVVLPYADSLNLHKLAWGGDERVIISPYPITIDSDETLRVLAPTPDEVKLSVYPLPAKERERKKSMLGRIAAFVVRPLTDAITEASGIFTIVKVPGAPVPPAAATSKFQNSKFQKNPKSQIPNSKNEDGGAGDAVLSLAKLGAGGGAVRVQKVRDAGAVRVIPKGRGARAVAVAPVDADFAAAAVWKISFSSEWLAQAEAEFASGGSEGRANRPGEPLPDDGSAGGFALPLNGTPATQPATNTSAGRITVASSVSLGDAYLKIKYTGDVARVLLDGKVVLDDFYNGQPLEFPLRRFVARLAAGAQLTVEILPLRRDAPILLPDSAWPRFGGRAAVAELSRAEIVQTFTHTLVPEAAEDDESDTDD
jgi:hypothetical protein